MNSTRLISLDFFRGLTIIAMILVNTPGDWGNIYAPFMHASWHGCTPTDLVFPFFLLIVGVSLSISLSKLTDKQAAYPKIFKRTILLFALGLALSFWGHPNFAEWRIMGVLQRIALVFCFSALIFLHFSQQKQLVLLLVILLSYWALMSLVPVDGLAANLDKNTNLAAYLDQLILGNHVWRFSKPYDPEGILSTLPAIGTGILGMQLGFLLKTQGTAYQKFTQIMGFGFVLLVLGWLWDFVFPLNKQLWTSSFVVYTAGWAYLVFGVCFYLLDIQRFDNLFVKFSIIFGSNPTVAYVLSGFIITLMARTTIGEENLKDLLYSNLFTTWLNPKNASLLFAVSYIFICFLPVWILYRKKIFVKI